MRLVLISDTHEQRPVLPDGDVLVHAGDLTMSGGLSYLREEIDWFKSQPHKHKIWIAGNHDWACQHFMAEGKEDMLRDMAAPATYLRDSAVNIDGKKFYGSPWQPWIGAFNLYRGRELKAKWDMIPRDTDVLVTHGPPKYILDWVRPEHVGCEDLARAANEIAPKIHVFGHNHCGYGRWKFGATKYFNASMVNEEYRLAPAQPPFEVEI